MNFLIIEQKAVIDQLSEQIKDLQKELLKQKESIDTIIANDSKNISSISNLNDTIKKFKPFKKTS